MLLIAIYGIYVFNRIIKAEAKVDEAFSLMDIYLKKRWDLIPNISEAVKTHLNFEKQVFTKLAELRNINYDNLKDKEKINLNEYLNGISKNINVIYENYPNLKTKDSVLNLMENLKNLEDEIAKSRKYFNGSVREYNNLIQIFPNNIFSKLLGKKKRKMFESNENMENINFEI